MAETDRPATALLSLVRGTALSDKKPLEYSRLESVGTYIF